MELIPGMKLRDYIEKIIDKEKKNIAVEVGKNIAIMHNNNIIHGDLTTSNMIITNQKEVYYIDFGLSFISTKVEDKAVDLHLFIRAIDAKHYKIKDLFLKAFFSSYKQHSKNRDETMNRLEKVENRGRNKGK